jgi:hypothetical protein
MLPQQGWGEMLPQQGWGEMRQLLVQLGVNNSIVVLGFSAQLPECFASDHALIRHLDQGTEKQEVSTYLRRETLG